MFFNATLRINVTFVSLLNVQIFLGVLCVFFKDNKVVFLLLVTFL